MKPVHMLREHLHINTKTMIHGEMLAPSLLCLSIFLYRTDSGQAVMSRAVRLARTTNSLKDTSGPGQEKQEEEKKECIGWMDFVVASETMSQAFRYDVDICQTEIHLDWVDLLAYPDARHGGDFSKYKPEHMGIMAEKLKTDETTIAGLTKDIKYHIYYRDAYGAVPDGTVGQFQAEIPVSGAPAAYLPSDVVGGAPGDPATAWAARYRLKAFFPIARRFPYSNLDDFGVAKSYDLKCQHLSHDMMGQVGTSVVAVESDYMGAIGWNQHGGWRLGVRSLDRKRYYYYAYLHKNYLYQSGLKGGSMVQAGGVVGYLGRTGYSRAENTDNINGPHLHFGLELVSGKSQEESDSEIWVSCYELVKFLNMSRCEAAKMGGIKE